MRTVVLGGTRFVGRAVVDELLAAGHEVLVVHRGVHEPDALPDVAHLHVDREQLTAARLAPFRADAAVDVSCSDEHDARVALAALPTEVRTVAVSSIDVYRAYGSLLAGAVTDPVPLTEESPLRDAPLPDATEYDNLGVERAYLERGAAVCRLPMVYGPHDYKRREGFVLDRLSEGRIPVGAGGFLWSRGYAPELARGIRLALEAPGEVFNLCEATCAPVRLWIEQIVAAAGAHVELTRVPDEQLPDDLEIAGDIAQHWMASAAKAERVLGWKHADPEAGVQASVAWHLDHPQG